jgi:threonine dehydrogenase-like Zn-dependent dehydrogenase
LAGVKQVVVIYGAGPVGLMAHSASKKVPVEIMVVDNHPDRLKLAEVGAIAMISQRVSSRASIELTNGVGADRGCECVGYQCCDKHGKEHSNATMNELYTGRKSNWFYRCCRGFVPKDPKSKEELQRGHMDFDFGQFWMKGQRIATGQANVKSITVSFLLDFCW